MPMKPADKHGRVWHKNMRPDSYAIPAGRGRRHREQKLAADLVNQLAHAQAYSPGVSPLLTQALTGGQGG